MEIKNPFIPLDYPDPDVIRVDDTYYMITTTMHFFPGGEILVSKDLVNWEHGAFVFDTLDHTPAQRLKDHQNIYGKGMWAATIRYHNGVFYVLFVANDTQKTYLYTSERIDGTWKKQEVEGFYHDASLLFDQDRVFLVYGNDTIWLTEMKSDLTGPKEGGIHKAIVSDSNNPKLGYEGAHFYKINNKYYLFLIHSLRDEWRRVQACFVAYRIDGPYEGKDILNDDRGYHYQGIAQGGIVDTPNGEWYAILFQDSGAVGRLPVLVPVTWKNDIPVLGETSRISMPIANVKPQTSLVGSDDFQKSYDTPYGFAPFWQVNHEPELSLINLGNGLTIQTNSVTSSLVETPNILTQRMLYPNSHAEVTIDGREMNAGDYAGLAAFQANYAYLALERTEVGWNLCLVEGNKKERIIKSIPFDSSTVRMGMRANFEEMSDTISFYYYLNEERMNIDRSFKMAFTLDHFVGCRYALFNRSSVTPGGQATFHDFEYFT